MTFQTLGLIEPILRAVQAEGYTVPTPIQIQAIPKVLQGTDLLGCAQTGTGKTAAFALPILQRLSAKDQKDHSHHGDPSRSRLSTRTIRSLILCPTRELASQIADSFHAYGRNLHLKHTVVFGGVNQHHQVRALRGPGGGVDILIATPGRLLDLMNQGHIDLRHVEIFVLDEADRMLDMGFIPDIRKIVAKIPKKRQTLLFSATMPDDIRRLADSILHQPQSVKVNPEAPTVETVAQSVYHVPNQNKAALLKSLLASNGVHRTLVFTRTKHRADKVVKELLRAGIRASAIHSNKSQNARTRALDSFKGSKPPVLVATDIASRGIDVDDITHVINFDMPNTPETYVHRIGRTARAGASGVAVSFCDPQERGDLKAIERLIRTQIEVNGTMPEGIEAWKDQGSESSHYRGNGNGHSGRDRHADSRGHRGQRPGPKKFRPRASSSSPSSTSSSHNRGAGHQSHSGTHHAAHHNQSKTSHPKAGGFLQRGRGKTRGGRR